VHSKWVDGKQQGQPISIGVQTWVQSSQILAKTVCYDATPDKKNQ
jgi:hypothetical protein